MLFGASGVGSIVKKMLDDLKIEFVCFADNSTQKQGRLFEGKEVLSIQAVKQQFPQAVVIICIRCTGNVEDVKHNILDAGLTVFPLEFFESFLVDYCVQNKIKPAPCFSSGYGELSLRVVALSVTERCTLRCKDCAYLMPYFNKPVNYPTEQVLKSIKNLAASVDFISAINLVGGEALLHPDIVEICAYAKTFPNIGGIRILTNATILPTAEQMKAFHKLKIFIDISDYGSLSKNKEALIALCKEYGLVPPVVLGSDMFWNAVEKPVKYSDSPEKNSYKYLTCASVVYCNHIVNGKYHLCSMSAMGSRLGMVEENKSDCVDLLDDSLTPKQRREQLLALMKDKNTLTACDYCSFNTKRVPRAVQVGGTLHAGE